MRSKFKWIFTLLVAFAMQISFAQQKSVSGTVLSDGQPLPGASVLIKGTQQGTQTDEKGKFSIKAKEGDVLEVSFLDKKTQSITVGSSSTYNVTMVASEKTIEAVLITGAMNIKRKPDAITTSNQIIKNDELTRVANPNVVQSLAGRVSGLQINTTSTGLTSGTSIQFRGSRSISGNNQALVVIDGVVSNAGVLALIDPNNIESINTLKGANAAALYGQLGNAGALIVTTKKGSKKDKITIDYSSSINFEEIAYLPETQNRYGQGWQGDFDWTDQSSWGPEYDGSTQVVGIPYPSSTDWRFGKYEHREDNFKDFFKTGLTYQNTLSIGLGSEKAGYANVSLNRIDTQGLIPDDKRSRNNVNVNFGKRFNKVRLSAITRYITDKTDRVSGDMYAKLSNTPGNIDVTMFNSGNNGDHWTLYDESPYWQLKNDRTNGKTDIAELVGEMQYYLNDNIDFLVRSTMRKTTGASEGFVNQYDDLPELTGTNRTIRSSYNYSMSDSRYMYTDVMANFKYELTPKIGLGSNIGVNLIDIKSASLGASGFDLTVPYFYDVSNIANIVNSSQSRSRQRSASAFANVDLNYDDYLFLNLTGRYDQDSRLSKENRDFFYPSVGLSFIPTNAFDGLKGKVLNKVKFAGSFVRTGNVNAIGVNEVQQVAGQAGGYPYFLTPQNSFLAETSYIDPQISNEFVNNIELLANFEFLPINNYPRITLDAVASSGTTEGQILGITTSNATGYGSSKINIGKTSSKSLEIDLGLTPVRTKNVTWNLNASYSTFKTIVDKVTDQSNRVGSGTPGIYAIEGEEFPMIMGTAYTRDDQGRVVLNSSGAPIRSSSLKMLGSTTPDYIVNFGTNFTYKNITITALGDYRTGHKFYSGVKEQLNSVGRTVESAENGREPFLYPNSTIEGSGVTNNSVLTGGTGSYASYQSYVTDNYGFFDENFVLDATALKLREVSLSYSFSKKVTDYIKASRLSLGVSARNLYTWLPKENRGYNDPETGSGLAGYSFTPPTRFYAFSLNLTF